MRVDKKKKQKRKMTPFAATFHTLINLFMILWSLLCFLPLLWMIMSSFKTRSEFMYNVGGIPKYPSLKNYISIIENGKIAGYMMNSLFVAVFAVIGALLLIFLLGYILSRFDFAGRNILKILILAGMTIPTLALMIPIYLQFSALNMLNSRWSLILYYSAMQIPMGVLLLESYLKSVPLEMEEAAVIEGASFVKILSHVIAPLCQPIFTTVGILSFIGAWNEYPMALMINSHESLKTLPVGLKDFAGQYTSDQPGQMAGLTIAIVPIIVIYLIFSKKITVKIVAGAVKG